MKRMIYFALLLMLFLGACAPATPSQETVIRENAPTVTVYRAPT